MSFLTTLQCDGCGTTTNEQDATDWWTATPTLLGDQRRRNVPVQSHFCGGCLSAVKSVMHRRVLTIGVPIQLRSDTVEMAVIDASLAATR